MKRDNILVPVDFSEASTNAIAEAIELAGDASHVHLLHVLPPLESISPGVVWGDVTDTNREQAVRKYAEKYLAEHSYQGVTFDVTIGQPGHEICEYAEQTDADMIVISSHGYHGMKRFLLGSVAEVVIRHAHVPVLVLRRADAE
jgi:nucleotide-binding universal stress UspA family protein